MPRYLLTNEHAKARKAGQYQLYTWQGEGGIWTVQLLRPDGLPVFQFDGCERESTSLNMALGDMVNGQTAQKLDGAVANGADLFAFAVVFDWLRGCTVNIFDARKGLELAEAFDLPKLASRLKEDYPALTKKGRGRKRDTRAHLAVRDVLTCWEFATGQKASVADNARFIKVAEVLGFDRTQVKNYIRQWHQSMPQQKMLELLAAELAKAPGS